MDPAKVSIHGNVTEGKASTVPVVPSDEKGEETECVPKQPFGKADTVFGSMDGISNTLSRNSLLEEMTSSDLGGPAFSGPDSISNEEISKDDLILETYIVLSDPIRGGMGSVWRVHHATWNTDLAMKRPQPRFFAEGSTRSKELFIHECENWINLGLHPNIVSCYYIRDIGGVPTIFSEWMENGSLKDRIMDGSLYAGTEKEQQLRLLDIAIQALRGLTYSHHCHLFHQDMKPGNLLLGENWEAKVSDFGLAMAESMLAEDGNRFSAGYTQAYCPKEQVDGAPAEAWMDLYAWALTVIESWCGVRFWEKGEDQEVICSQVDSHCRLRFPAELRDLLLNCICSKDTDEMKLETSLLQIYQDTAGMEYGRGSVEDVMLAADSLNNKALSLLDLGKAEEADQIWQNALLNNPHHKDAAFNYALFQWRSGRIDPYRAIEQISIAYEMKEYYPKVVEEIFRECGNNGIECPFNIDDEVTETIHVESAPEEEEEKQPEAVLDDAIRSQCEDIYGQDYKIVENESYIYAVTSRSATEHRYKDGKHDRQGATLAVFSKSTGKLLDRIHWNDSDDILWEGIPSKTIIIGNMLLLKGDQSIRVYQPETKEMRTVKKEVNFISLNPQKTLVVSGGFDDQRLDVWRLPNLEHLFGSDAHDVALAGAKFSPDGTLMISWDYSHKIRIWSIPSGRCLKAYIYGDREGTIGFTEDSRCMTLRKENDLRIIPIGPFTYQASWRLSRINTSLKALEIQREYKRYLSETKKRLEEKDWSGAFDQIRQARKLPGYSHHPDIMALKRRALQESGLKPVRISDAWETMRIKAPEEGRAVFLVSESKIYAICKKSVYRFDKEAWEWIRQFSVAVPSLVTADISLDGRHLLVMGTIEEESNTGFFAVQHMADGSVVCREKIRGVPRYAAFSHDSQLFAVGTSFAAKIISVQSGHSVWEMNHGIQCLQWDKRTATLYLSQGNINESDVFWTITIQDLTSLPQAESVCINHNYSASFKPVISPDGSQYLMGLGNQILENTLILLKPAEEGPEMRISFIGRAASVAAYMKESRFVAVASEFGDLGVWNTDNLELQKIEVTFPRESIGKLLWREECSELLCTAKPFNRYDAHILHILYMDFDDQASWDLFKPYMGEEDFIFVCYDHSDAEEVYKIITALNNKGYRIFHDGGIDLSETDISESYADQWREKLRKCKVFLSFLSSRYFASQLCTMELNIACSNKRTVIPLMLEEFQLPDEVEFKLSQTNKVFRSWFDSAEECAGELAEAYAKYLDSCKAESITEQLKQEEPSKEADPPENENRMDPSPAENVSKPRKQGFFGSLLSRRKKK